MRPLTRMPTPGDSRTTPQKKNRDCKINFEIEDAINKLERLELVTREGGMLQCLPLAEAKRRLDHIWDNYFTFNTKPN